MSDPGKSKYEDVVTEIAERLGAAAVALAVVDGNRGTGAALQLRVPPAEIGSYTHLMAQTLRTWADAIAADAGQKPSPPPATDASSFAMLAVKQISHAAQAAGLSPPDLLPIAAVIIGSLAATERGVDQAMAVVREIAIAFYADKVSS